MLPIAGPPRRPTARRRLATALALLLVLLVPSLAAQSPFPPGSNATISFDREVPHYMQGEKVTIRLGGGSLDPGSMRLEVRCVDCPDKDDVYVGPAQPEVVFPDNFGAVARDKFQPRWNGTWSVRLMLGNQVMQEAFFHSWLYDAFRYPQHRPHPTGNLNVVSVGHPPGELVQLTLRHRRADGSWENVAVADLRVLSDGRVTYFWSIDRSEASRLSCPQHPVPNFCQHYELVVKGEDKGEERVRFRVVPAHTHYIPTGGPGSGITPAVVQRSVDVNVSMWVRYPNRLTVRPQDLVSARNPEGAVKVQVERYEGEQAGNPPRIVANLTSWYDETSQQWSANWTVPRNESLRADYRYRFVIADQRDRYGNVVSYGAINNFTVSAAILTPKFVTVPKEVERTDLAKVVLALRYHDDSPLEPGDNATALRACFLKDDPGPATCDRGYPAKAEYAGDGLWNFTHRFPRDYPDLSDHDFLFEGGATHGRDQWGNTFQNAYTGAFSFPVVPARLRVNLTSVVDGELRTAERGWDRGDRVTLTATITYPDGTLFDAAHNKDRRERIPLSLLKQTSEGAVAGEETVNLTNRAGTGKWTGDVQLSRDAARTPAGVWQLRLDVRDNVSTPNGNSTAFLRTVNPTGITVIPTKQPALTAKIGDRVEFRFRLAYGDGTSVRANDLGSTIQVNVIRMVGPFAGTSVSGSLLPTYDPVRDDWSVEWQVPNIHFAGTFSFKPTGTDRHGNVLDRDARSRTFTTFTDSTTRVVIQEPPTRVERGETVVAVFDGRDGDQSFTGFPGSLPVIELQRLDASGAWVTERQNVRAPDEGDGDHVARVQTTISTQLGTYRFHLRARDSSYNLVNGTSQPFAIAPTNVTRALLLPPPERVGKGQFIQWSVERLAGDGLRQVDVLFDGESIRESNLVGGLLAVAGPISQTGADRVNFTWRVPYGFASGAYSFRVEGRDAFQNLILVDVPPVLTEPAILSGQVLAHPERVQRRGADVSFLFAITYPNGDFFVPQGTPNVVVVNASGIVDRATVTYTGTVYEARWRPPLGADLDDHWFEVTGQDATGNVFPSLRSSEFRLTPGTYERRLVSEPRLSVTRTQELRVELPKQPDDVFVSFTLGYVSDANQLTEALVQQREATAVATLEHTVDDGAGRYVVSWTPRREEKLGVYVIQFSGLDASGNEFRGRSQAFAVNGVQIDPVIDAVSDADKLEPGKTAAFSFTLRYAYTSGAPRPVSPDTVAPDAVMMFETIPINDPRPTVTYDLATRKWVAEWTAPEVLPNGRYVLVVQGEDDAGNRIIPRQSTIMVVEKPVVHSLFRAVQVPGPDAALALLAVLGAVLALGLAGRRRRDA